MYFGKINFIFSFVIFSLAIFDYIDSEIVSSSSSVLFRSKLSGPINDFGLDFLQHLNSKESPKNVLFSPLSVVIAYGMILEGATGQTEEQIKSVLRLSSVGSQTSDVSDAIKELLEDYKLVEGDSSLTIANLLLFDKKVKLDASYSQRLSTSYDTQATAGNFRNPTEIMKYVNSWVSEKTKNEVNTMLDDPPDPESLLMLLSTIYFKGQWETPFLKGETADETFKNADGTTENIKMMIIRSGIFNFAYNKDKQLKIIELPYLGNFSMIFIISTESENLVPRLDATELNNLLSSMKKAQVSPLKIPKFELEDVHELHQILPLMGMDSPFSNAAELPNIAKGLQLKVSQSIQKGLIKVDEEGTIAAISTSISANARSGRNTEIFIADRPFLFIIRCNSNGVNFFMGQMIKIVVKDA